MQVDLDTNVINICFDSLLTESRCSSGANCPSAGYTLAIFIVNFTAKTHTFKLSTTAVLNFKNDTTIACINLHLDSLNPYPSIWSVYPFSAYKTKVVVSK